MVIVVLEIVEESFLDSTAASCAVNCLPFCRVTGMEGDGVLLVGISSVAMVQCHLVDAHGIIAVPERQIVEPLEDSDFLLSTRVSHMASQLFQFVALVVFVQRGKLGFLVGQDEVGAVLLDALARLGNQSIHHRG